MENSSSNQEPWCSPGVTALVTGAVVGAASFFGSRFFVPQITDQEKDERIKFREAFEEYKRQVEFDTDECCFIKELLNDHLLKLEHMCSAISNLLPKKEVSALTSSMPDTSSSITDSASDEELEKKLYSLLNSYPYLAHLKNINSDDIRQCISARQEHHALVVLFAEIVLKELTIFEDEGIRKYKKYSSEYSLMASK